MLNTFPPKNKKPVGRPEIPLFTDDQKDIEEDFLRRAGLLIDLYYRDEPKSKLNYVFGSNGSLSKTFVWSCIYLYYVHENMMQENLRAFVTKIKETFGGKVISDRTSIFDGYYRLKEHKVHLDEERSGENRNQCKSIIREHADYLFLIDLWKSL